MFVEFGGRFRPGILNSRKLGKLRDKASIDSTMNSRSRPVPKKGTHTTVIDAFDTFEPTTYKTRRTRWMPFHLHRLVTTVLVSILFLSIAALKLLQWFLKDGVDVRDTKSVHALRFVPTILAILIGFAWKGLSSDLSLVTPWAAISGQWAKASDSILLNYMDSLDIVTLWQSLKRRHWALFLVVLGGLLSGTLVPLANALTVVELGVSGNRTTTFSTTDKFDFNGSLGLAPGWRSAQVWLDYTGFNNDINETAHFPWLTTNHAYPAFDTVGLENALIQGTVPAFSASLDCEPVEYRGAYSPLQQNSSILLESTGSSRCSRPISQTVLWPWNSSNVVLYPKNESTGYFSIPPNMWLNVTACDGDDDMQMLATTMVLDVPNNLHTNAYSNGTKNFWNSTNVWTVEDIGIRATGFICSPTYWSTPASITVNGTTGMIGSFPFLPYGEPTKIDNLGVGLDVIIAAMNNPIDPRSQMVIRAAATNNYSTSELPDTYNWTRFSQLEVMQKYSWTYLSYSSLYDAIGTAPADPFFKFVTGSNNLTAWSMFNNASMLKDTMERNFAQFLPTLVDAAARTPDNVTIHGYSAVPSTKLLIRPDIVAAMIGLLAALALIAILVMTFLRPVTLWTQHPGALQYIAMLLADSPKVDSLFVGLGSCSEHSLRRHLRGTEFCLSQSEHGVLQLQMRRRDAMLEDSDVDRDPIGTLASGGTIQMNALMPKVDSLPTDLSITTRYRPLALKFGSRLAMLASLVAVAVAAILVLHFSLKHDGFHGISSSTSAWDLVPTVILVLIGYCIQSLLHNALGLVNYTQLASNSAYSGRAMKRRHVQDASRILMERWSTDWILIAIPCFLLLIGLPGLKITAGNLFHQGVGSSTIFGNIPVNISQIQNFNSMLQYINTSYSPYYTNLYAQTVSQNLAVSRPIFQSFASIGPLSLPVLEYNISSLLRESPQTTENDLFETRMPALNTSTTCSPSEDQDFGLFATVCNSSTGYTFEFQCISSQCRNQYGMALSAVDVGITVAPSIDGKADVSNPYFTVSVPSRTDDSLVVLIADFSPLSNEGLDLSEIQCNNKSIDASLLGNSMPDLRGVNCTRHINLVDVNVTFSRQAVGTTNSIGTSQTEETYAPRQTWYVLETAKLFSVHQQTAFRPIGYDPASIDLVAQAIEPTTWPASILIPDTGTTIYHAGATLDPLIEQYDFLNLLIQAQEIRSDNQLDLLNVTTLAATTSDVYQNYTQVALERTMASLYDGFLSRYIPPNAIPSAETRNTTGGQFTLFEPVVRQAVGWTIAGIVLVIAVFICVAFVSVAIPRGTLLPKAPGSIGAQMSILAGSRFVAKLRDQPQNEDERNLFETEKFGLGWWSADAAQSSPDDLTRESKAMRWGVDVGVLEDETHQKLRSRTFRSTLSNRDSAIRETSHVSSTLNIPSRVARIASRTKGSARSTTSYQPLTLDDGVDDPAQFRNDFENSIRNR